MTTFPVVNSVLLTTLLASITYFLWFCTPSNTYDCYENKTIFSTAWLCRWSISLMACPHNKTLQCSTQVPMCMFILSMSQVSAISLHFVLKGTLRLLSNHHANIHVCILHPETWVWEVLDSMLQPTHLPSHSVSGWLPHFVTVGYY